MSVQCGGFGYDAALSRTNAISRTSHARRDVSVQCGGFGYDAARECGGGVGGRRWIERKKETRPRLKKRKKTH